ncbi:MAG: pilus assembly protein [Acidobacteria bacterium]|nr:pilus assembly protein [Acidobacteriota bacterium]
MTLGSTRSSTRGSTKHHFLETLLSDRGTELFEFALIAPLLLTLLLGIVWFGRAYNVYQSITRAAREGARYAVLPNCATCGNTYADNYAQAGTCLANPTSSFTNYIAPALTAAHVDPQQVSNFCQKADWLENTSPRQCGVVISFAYPVHVTIPFTSLNGTNFNVSTQVQMRLENQRVDGSGNPTCP